MSEASSLSQMSVSDEYEDLVFRKVMAIYIANESARISSEVEKANAEGETTVNSKTINRLFSKANSKKYLNVIRRSAKKIISVAAMLVFVAAVSLTSYVIGIAGVKANVSKAFTQMDVTDYGEYIQVLPSERKEKVQKNLFLNMRRMILKIGRFLMPPPMFPKDMRNIASTPKVKKCSTENTVTTNVISLYLNQIQPAL